jgi:hypothetical protein
MIRQRNPAWVDKALRDNWSKLQTMVGEKWMPIPSVEHDRVMGHYTGWIPSSGAQAGKKMWEYGSGHYGSVLPTRDPQVVLKVTSDPAEAQFVAYASSIGSFPEGLVKYFRIVELPGSFRSRSIFAIWREAAHHVGLYVYGNQVPELLNVDKRTATEGREYLRRFKDTGHEVFMWLKKHPGSLAQIQQSAETVDYDDVSEFVTQGKISPRFRGAQKIALFYAALEPMTEWMYNTDDITYVGQALGFYLERGVLLADVHANNVGLVDRPGFNGPIAVITDPGHAVFLKPQQYAAPSRVANSSKKKSSKTWTCTRIRKEVATWPQNWQTRFRGFEMVCGTEKAFERVSCEYRHYATKNCEQFKLKARR